MGKVRRYKKKLAKAAAETNDSGERDEHSQQTDYLKLAEGLLDLRKDDDKMSVCSVMKSVKSLYNGDSLNLKKDSKRYLKHAFLLKSSLMLFLYTTYTFFFKFIVQKFFFFSGLEKTQKSISKKKKKSCKDDNSDDDDDDDKDCEVGAINKRELYWPTPTINYSEHRKPLKKHGKGYQKKQNAQL